MADDTLRVAAGNTGFEKRIQDMAASVSARFRYHSIELPDGSVLPGLQTVQHLRQRLALFGLEEDLRGKRVLDVGAWDGWFSFECERRGADVVAVDCVALDTFLEARELLSSRVEYLTLDVTELSAQRLGRFDIVLFFGVLYHLRHPLLGLEKIVELCTDRALIESFVIPREDRTVPAVMEFYERAELGGQIDNWCGPSPECLVAMCRSAGFAQVELKDITNQRASVVCRRHWPEPGLEMPEGAAAHLHSATNNRTYVASFHPDKEEYICCYFKFPGLGLTSDCVRVEVDGYGVPGLVLSPNGPGSWQVNCLRPPGLIPGRHQVRIRIRDGKRSNAVEFVMLDSAGKEVESPSPELPGDAPELCSVELHSPGDRRLAVNREGSLVCYLRSPAEVMGTPDLLIEAGGVVLHPDILSCLGGGVWQANVLLHQPIPVGTKVRIRLIGGKWSEKLPATPAP